MQQQSSRLPSKQQTLTDHLASAPREAIGSSFYWFFVSTSNNNLRSTHRHSDLTHRASSLVAASLASRHPQIMVALSLCTWFPHTCDQQPHFHEQDSGPHTPASSLLFCCFPRFMKFLCSHDQKTSDDYTSSLCSFRASQFSLVAYCRFTRFMHASVVQS